MMGMKYEGKMLLVGLVSCMLLAQIAIATIVEVEVEGVVDKVNELGGFGFDGSVAIGSVMSGYFRYDSEAVDQVLPEHTGLYSVISVSLSVGNYRFYNDPLGAKEPFFTVTTVDWTYEVRSPDSRFDGTMYVGGIAKNFDEVEFYLTDVGLLDLWTSVSGYIVDDSLPMSFPPASEFNMRRRMGIGFGGPGIDGEGFLGIGGELTSIRVIPEPVSIWLLGFGGLAALMRKRRDARDGV